MNKEIKRQALGFAYGMSIVVGLALAEELQRQLGLINTPDWASFTNISLAGLALVGVRSAVSFTVAFLTQRNA